MQNNYFVERLLMAPCVNVMEVKRIVYALLSEIASLWRKVYVNRYTPSENYSI